MASFATGTYYRVGQKKYDCLIYYNLKSKKAITLK
jgi:hypothetical protein